MKSAFEFTESNLTRLKQNTEKHINKIKCETKQLKI